MKISDDIHFFYIKDLYQWYYCDEEPTIEREFARAMLEIISSEKASSFSTTDYGGKYIVCEVMPLSVEGAMGVSVCSNVVYITE